MTVETQVLRALADGRVASLVGLMRAGQCCRNRALRAVGVLVTLGLIRRGQFGRRRWVYFSV